MSSLRLNSSVDFKILKISVGSSLVSIKVLCIFCCSYNFWLPVSFDCLQIEVNRVISTVIAMTLPKIVTTVINNTLTKK